MYSIIKFYLKEMSGFNDLFEILGVNQSIDKELLQKLTEVTQDVKQLKQGVAESKIESVYLSESSYLNFKNIIIFSSIVIVSVLMYVAFTGQSTVVDSNLILSTQLRSNSEIIINCV